MPKVLRIISQDGMIDIDYFSSVLAQSNNNLYAYNQGERFYLGTYDNIECQRIMQDIRTKAYEIDDGVNVYEMLEEEV